MIYIRTSTALINKLWVFLSCHPSVLLSFWNNNRFWLWFYRKIPKIPSSFNSFHFNSHWNSFYLHFSTEAKIPLNLIHFRLECGAPWYAQCLHLPLHSFQKSPLNAYICHVYKITSEQLSWTWIKVRERREKSNEFSGFFEKDWLWWESREWNPGSQLKQQTESFNIDFYPENSISKFECLLIGKCLRRFNWISVESACNFNNLH